MTFLADGPNLGLIDLRMGSQECGGLFRPDVEKKRREGTAVSGKVAGGAAPPVVYGRRFGGEQRNAPSSSTSTTMGSRWTPKEWAGPNPPVGTGWLKDGPHYARSGKR